jgi:hypothetical protein
LPKTYNSSLQVLLVNIPANFQDTDTNARYIEAYIPYGYSVNGTVQTTASTITITETSKPTVTIYKNGVINYGNSNYSNSTNYMDLTSANNRLYTLGTSALAYSIYTYWNCIRIRLYPQHGNITTDIYTVFFNFNTVFTCSATSTIYTNAGCIINPTTTTSAYTAATTTTAPGLNYTVQSITENGDFNPVPSNINGTGAFKRLFTNGITIPYLTLPSFGVNDIGYIVSGTITTTALTTSYTTVSAIGLTPGCWHITWNLYCSNSGNNTLLQLGLGQSTTTTFAQSSSGGFNSFDVSSSISYTVQYPSTFSIKGFAKYSGGATTITPIVNFTTNYLTSLRAVRIA